MTATTCPYCSKAYTWNDDQDAYLGAEEVVVTTGRGKARREVTLFVCECGGTVGVMVQEGQGMSLYTAEDM